MEFNISYDFAEKYVRFSKAEFIQLYVYAKYLNHRDNAFPTPDALAKELDLPLDRVIYILDFWSSRNEIISTPLGYAFPDTSAPSPKLTQRKCKPKVTRPSYSMKEIDAAAAVNKSISGLFYQAETVLNKVLTPSDMEMLYSFVDWLGLPVEVITMLLSYASKRNKTGRRYLETVAIDWAEKGIDTFEAAEAYVMELEALDSVERKIRNILGIYDRALTTTEKKYISQWTTDERLSSDLISLAYDRTVLNTGKLSFAYMNKILLSWADDGVRTIEEAENWTGQIKTDRKTPAKRSKFNNYNDTNEIDYSALEEQLLDMMLD